MNDLTTRPASLKFVASWLSIFLAIIVVAVAPTMVFAQTRIGDLTRLKGHEENVVHGIGLVVGLEGTGDTDFAQTQRALAQYMNLMEMPIPRDGLGQFDTKELADAKNVALVFITATIPGVGARQGDRLNCQVNAIGAKSLAGGTLMLSPLLGPRPGDQTVYALAQGPIQLTNPRQLRSGTISGGARLEANFQNSYIKDGAITLVLDQDHAIFPLAGEIVETINNDLPELQSLGYGDIAKAIDPVTVVVKIPEPFQAEPVTFIASIQSLQIYDPPSQARVIINEKTQVIVMTDDVRVGPVTVTHGATSIQTGQFVEVDSTNGATGGTVPLSSLVAALNAVKADRQEMIDIIKELHKSGKLYGRLIIE